MTRRLMIIVDLDEDAEPVDHDATDLANEILVDAGVTRSAGVGHLVRPEHRVDAWKRLGPPWRSW